MTNFHKARTIPVKMALVDNGIAPLVQWLGRLQGVNTLHSCEDNSTPSGGRQCTAYVMFTIFSVDDPFIRLGELIDGIYERLGVADESRWFTTIYCRHKTPIFTLHIEPQLLAASLHRFKEGWTYEKETEATASKLRIARKRWAAGLQQGRKDTRQASRKIRHPPRRNPNAATLAIGYRAKLRRHRSK